ncbi:hypothetical protein V493_00124 [Pseudogymnoascus sp. VKM F-4281 (FW-2241)]|nr:hypothetical protein V493_00124 [Pseudogymnoascus sp. VKM F-4281 (FW-2241)]
MAEIAKLTGPNYRVWSLRVKRLLQSRGLWDVVEPLPKPEPPVAGSQAPIGADASTVAPPQAADFEIRDAQASCLIMELCDTIPLDLIISIECARSQWARLRRLYGPSFGQYQGLRDDFEEFVAKAGGKGWAQIAGELETLRELIGEVPGGLRLSEVEMLEVLNDIAKGKGGEYGTLAGYLRLKGEYKYENMLMSLVSLEWEEARDKAGGAAGSSRARNKGVRKWGGGKQ